MSLAVVLVGVTHGGQATRTGLAIFLGVTVIAGVLVLILLGQRTPEGRAGTGRFRPDNDSTSARRETKHMVQLWTGTADPQGGNGGGQADRASEGVAAILRAAEAAAVEIRVAAEQEADAIRQRAMDEAATAAAEVARKRREVDRYAQTQREDAQREAARIRKEAESAAKELERAAKSRHRNLVLESERLRKWLEDSITPMQDTIGRLQAVLTVDADARPRDERPRKASTPSAGERRPEVPVPTQGAPAS